jgi:sodium/potassium-transporting ATPase subunit alpha
MAQSRTFARKAYRVLAVAMRNIEQGIEKLDIDQVEQHLTFLGLVAMMDPPRHEVPEAIARCRQAGVRTIMITGDHPLTALAIARQIGLATEESRTELGNYAPVIEGHQVQTMSDGAMKRCASSSRLPVPASLSRSSRAWPPGTRCVWCLY